ncbi:transmembrane protein 237A isoform X2 [Gouania willdenowi]|uniref:transmembrane protein 237A isoform X2 n=1 Tax=Gouania willdenowi TaxID=441366 RepID=UPI0010545893|nr:transmembrane protein 237 isoform X2 [Gouania willdenowi]
MPTVKSKKKKSKKEVIDREEKGEGTVEVEMEEVTNSRHSESKEHLTPEPQDPAPQKKKKKKRTPTVDQDMERADTPNGDFLDPAMDAEEMPVAVTRRTKRKKKTKTAEQVSNELGVEDDDFVTEAQSPIPQQSLFSAPHGHSQPMGKAFVERNRRFQAERADQFRRSETVDDYMDSRQMWTTRDVALKVHSSFRVNLAKTSMALRGFLTLDPAALASFLYFIALILSLSQQMTSDRINLYPTANDTLWPPGSEQQILRPWIVVNLVVALLVGLAWAVVSTRPEVDYTEDFLMTMELEGCSRADENVEFPA